jgi:transitional endoplasmic reticulum ATPase
VKEVFAQARKESPALIFLDELDSVAPPRGRYNDCLTQEVTAELLTEMDGVSSNGQAILVCGATNRMDMVDGALLSRFTEHIAFELPGPEHRLQLLQLFVGKTAFGGTNGTTPIEILARLALLTEGKSGRDLRNLVDKARMRAIKRAIKNGNDKPLALCEADFTTTRNTQ